MMREKAQITTNNNIPWLNLCPGPCSPQSHRPQPPQPALLPPPHPRSRPRPTRPLLSDGFCISVGHGLIKPVLTHCEGLALCQLCGTVNKLTPKQLVESAVFQDTELHCTEVEFT